MFICCNCGKECDIISKEEYRGEYWGIPAYETMAYSDCCECDFEEVSDDYFDDEESEEEDYE